jgi:hypothetical protein
MKYILRINKIEQTNIQADGYLIDYDNHELYEQLIKQHVDIYILCDTLIHEGKTIEIPNCQGLFFQDFSLIKRYKDKYKLYYYSLTMGTNSYEIQEILKDCNGVFISKELNLKDIKLIQNNIAKGLCYFACGNQKIFYSYRKLLSIALEKEEPLTNYYIKERKREYLMPIDQKNHETTIYTPYIFTNIKHLKNFIDFDIQLIDIANYPLSFIRDIMSCYRCEMSYRNLLIKYPEYYFFDGLTNEARVVK